MPGDTTTTTSSEPSTLTAQLSAELKVPGSFTSTASMSRVKRLSRRPLGCESKKDIGSRIIWVWWWLSVRTLWQHCTQTYTRTKARTTKHKAAIDNNVYHTLFSSSACIFRLAALLPMTRVSCLRN